MKVTQIFRSSKDERVISELTIGEADQAPIPVAGDNVRWIVKKIKCIPVASNPGSFPTALPTKLASKDRDEVDITAVLTVELS
jgi:hypothetical protein